VQAYAAPLELGHLLRETPKGWAYGHVNEHPFMRPGADKSRDAVQKMIINGIDDTLKNMGGMK
jgi:hypothetical protein